MRLSDSEESGGVAFQQVYFVLSLRYSASMVNIQTLAFLDLETVGLISEAPADPVNQRWIPGKPDERNVRRLMDYYMKSGLRLRD